MKRSTLRSGIREISNDGSRMKSFSSRLSAVGPPLSVEQEAMLRKGLHQEVGRARPKPGQDLQLDIHQQQGRTVQPVHTF